MTHFPLKDLLPQDVQEIYEEAKATMDSTGRVCTSTAINEVDQHQTRIEQSQSSTDTLLSFLVREKNSLLASIEAVKAMQKDLERHSKRCTRKYWLLKNSQSK